ncbi:MAG: transposase [Thermodesulfobacteriota bacterium]
MPRLARLDAPGVLQHVIARGIERREIFADDKDRQSFLDRLGDILTETKTQCFAWVLIPNHIHLLLRTGSTPLSRAMKRLLTGHAVYFNKRHQRSGHLFQNRYTSFVCEEDPYLLELVRYIHLNPLRAGLVKDLSELDRHLWSGHGVIMGGNKNDWQDVEEVLLYFSDRIGRARRAYRRFLEQGIAQRRRPDLQSGGARELGGEEKAENIFDPRVLGKGNFVERVLREANAKTVKRKARIPLPELIGKVKIFLGMQGEDLLTGRRKREVSSARALVSYIAVQEMGYRFTEVGQALNIHPVNIARSLEKGEKLFDKCREKWDGD